MEQVTNHSQLFQEDCPLWNKNSRQVHITRSYDRDEYHDPLSDSYKLVLMNMGFLMLLNTHAMATIISGPSSTINCLNTPLFLYCSFSFNLLQLYSFPFFHLLWK